MRYVSYKRIVLTVCLILAGAFVTRADGPFILQPLRVPLAGDLGTLEALFVRPSEPGRYPLALIAHGSPRSPAERPNMTPLAMLPQALEFVRRGWAAVIVMRRGYGGSDGGCQRRCKEKAECAPTRRSSGSCPASATQKPRKTNGSRILKPLHVSS